MINQCKSAPSPNMTNSTGRIFSSLRETHFFQFLLGKAESSHSSYGLIHTSHPIPKSLWMCMVYIKYLSGLLSEINFSWFRQLGGGWKWRMVVLVAHTPSLWVSQHMCLVLRHCNWLPFLPENYVCWSCQPHSSGRIAVGQAKGQLTFNRTIPIIPRGARYLLLPFRQLLD